MRISLPLAVVFWAVVSIVAPRFLAIVLAVLACIALTVASKELIEAVRERRDD